MAMYPVGIRFANRRIPSHTVELCSVLAFYQAGPSGIRSSRSSHSTPAINRRCDDCDELIGGGGDKAQARFGAFLRGFVSAQRGRKVAVAIHLETRSADSPSLWPMRLRHDGVRLAPQQRGLLRHRDRVRIGHATSAAIA